MPDPNPIAGLYPSPPQPGQNALSNPWQAIAGISMLQANQRANQLFQGQIAAGNALMKGLNPDGTFDPAAAFTAAQGGPSLGPAGSQFTGDLLTRRGQDIDNATRKLNLGVNNNAAIASIMAPYANQDTLSSEDQYNIKAKLAAAGVDPATVAAADITTPFKTLKAARVGAIQTMGAGAAAQPVVGAPNPATGAPTVQPLGTTVGAGSRDVGMPPGQSEAIAANRASFVNDQQRSAATLANIRPLQNALPLLQQMSASDFGPGSQGFSQVKSALITAGVIPPNATDTEVRQETNKYLHVYSGAARGAERSDQGLSQAIASNPNLDLTQGANLALVKNQIGMDRMDAALPQSFHGDAANYGNYKAQFYQNNDPRAFSWDIMTPQERRTAIDSFPKGKNGQPDQTSPAFQKFAKSYALAKATNIIQPPGAQNGPQQ